MGNTKTKTQEEHNMKTAGYWACRNEIIAAHLAAPHRYEPFTELFDVAQLDAIRDAAQTQAARSWQWPTS